MSEKQGPAGRPVLSFAHTEDFMKYLPIADLLLSRRLITEEQLENAMRQAGGEGEQALARELVAQGAIEADTLTQVMGEHLGLEIVDLKNVDVDAQVPHLLNEDFLRRHNVIPFGIEGDVIHLAFFPPMDMSVMDEVELTTGYRIRPFVASERDIQFALNQQFSAQHRTRQTIIDMHVEDREPSSEDIILDEVMDTVESPPIVRLVMDIIDGAINERASDIHLEPQEAETRVRYRVDGILQDVMHIPRNIESSVVSRVKILSNMDITEKRLPQDGHLMIKKGGREFDVRVSSFLTVNGEKIVMRILSKDTMLKDMEELGLNPQDLSMLKQLTIKPYGMLLVTGPTGCGKTTTLYSILSRINTREENVVTIEDPVEYRLPGINQSTVNPGAGITFATGLRSLLRQDPNVIMVGEVRDTDTASVAVQASLTGHLVFSTLHTSDAASAVIRLVDMGIKEYLISASLIGVVAQRLVRTVCPSCKETYRVDIQELFREFGITSGRRGKAVLTRGAGCKFCGNTGFQGRVGVFEVMRVSENVRRAILMGEPAHVIRQIAVSEGMSSLQHSAFRKVVEGQTTLDEVRRAVFINID